MGCFGHQELAYLFITYGKCKGKVQSWRSNSRFPKSKQGHFFQACFWANCLNIIFLYKVKTKKRKICALFLTETKLLKKSLNFHGDEIIPKIMLVEKLHCISDATFHYSDCMKFSIQIMEINSQSDLKLENNVMSKKPLKKFQYVLFLLTTNRKRKGV